MIDIRGFILGLSIAIVVAVLVSFFTHLPYWVSLGIVIFAMVANSFIAEMEDNMPGGFNNPIDEGQSMQRPVEDD
jgi:hypothetical protein